MLTATPVFKLSIIVIIILYHVDCQGQSKNDAAWIQTSDGCKVFNPHPVKHETIVWSGGCTDGYANGEGTLSWFKKGKKNQEYNGQMKRGQPHGQGTYNYLDGEIHEGEYRHGELEGQGQIIQRDKTGTITYSYAGEFKNGSPNGYGKEIHFYAVGGDTSSVYQGNFLGWYNRHGQGILKQFYGHEVRIIKGEFKANSVEGEAEIWKYVDEELTAYYKGNYQNEGRNGYGEEAYGCNKYLGEWRRNKKEGNGRLVMDSILIYDGEWRNDKFNGIGKRFFFDGSHYLGEFKNNQRDGLGVLYWDDGTRYVGEFKKELFNGLGYTSKDGIIGSPGVWKNGTLVKPDIYEWVRQRLESNHKNNIESLGITLD